MSLKYKMNFVKVSMLLGNLKFKITMFQLPDLNGTFLTSYGIDEARTRAIDMMQIDYKCCGAIRFEDWRSSYWFHQNESLPIIRVHGKRLVPDTCCITITENCGKRDHPSNIPYTVSKYSKFHELYIIH